MWVLSMPSTPPPGQIGESNVPHKPLQNLVNCPPRSWCHVCLHKAGRLLINAAVLKQELLIRSAVTPSAALSVTNMTYIACDSLTLVRSTEALLSVSFCALQTL